MAEVIDVTGEVISPDHENITPLFMRHLAAYKFFLGYVKGKKVLEVGFGEGYGTDYLAREAAEITAVDVSQQLVEHARRKYAKTNVWFMRADATAFPFPENSFDVLVSSQVLEHVKDYMRFLKEAKRVLRPGGTAIFATPNRKAMIDGVNPYHYKEFSAGELKAALDEVFGGCELTALFGSPRYMEIKKLEQGFAGKILAVDFLRLRRFVPRFIKKPLYKRAYESVQKNVEGGSGRGDDITVDDFQAGGGDPGKGLDLIGICVKGARG
ncbi:MAG TPA: class I SAM-dependent methyltransferase [Nitrospirota bacterium]|jgi:ubiquinone/menaquinone biosynthesis C-methylase UbiE